MIDYNIVDYQDAVELIKKYVQDTHDEVGPFPIDLDPNYEAYEAYADNGSLAMFTATDRDELIGYSVFVIGNHMFYANLLVGMSDLIYVRPEFRGEISKEFIQFIDEKLYTDFGVDAIAISMNTKKNFSGLLEHLGYQTTGIVCTKYVGDQ